MGIITVRIRRKLNKHEGIEVVKALVQWFDEHPLRKTCKTSIGPAGMHTFHRDRIVKQVMKLVKT